MDNEGGDHGESRYDIADDLVSIPTTSTEFNHESSLEVGIGKTEHLAPYDPAKLFVTFRCDTFADLRFPSE